MNKTELAAQVAARTEISKAEASKYVNVVLGVIADNLSEGDAEVSIPDFGRFFVKDVPARTGINPQTKEKINIEAHKKVVFKASDNLGYFTRKHC
jgi:DNA-binding protein HU-beta/DNA-binding protein HU-alpha